MSSWQTTQPPQDGTEFLADIGYPWPVLAAWNGCDDCYVYANLQVNMVNGIYNDTYFETERENASEIKRWKPMPGLSE